MRQLALFVAAATACAIGVLFACGGSDAGGGGGGNDGGGADVTAPPTDAGPGDSGPLPPPTPGAGSDFCDKTYKSYFDAYTSCCTAVDKTQPAYAFLGLLTVVVQACEKDLEASIAKGRITIDPTSAASCESVFQTLVADGVCGKTSTQIAGEISSIPQGTAACTTSVVGLVPSGQPCAGEYECQAGLTCVGWTSGSDGTCRTPGGADAGCGQGPSEAGSLTVNLTFGPRPQCAAGFFCQDRTCAAQLADGHACSQDQECLAGKCHEATCGSQGPTGAGTPCESNSDCLDVLWCEHPDGGTVGSGSCAPKEDAGASCKGTGSVLQTGECKGLCDAPDGSTAGTCITFCGSG